MRILLCCLLIARCILGCSPATIQKKTKVVMLAIDGLRSDHFGLDLPNLRKVGENGVRAEWLEPSYITLSIPSFYTIATGLYAESHGVISNYFFDTGINTKYTTEETMNITHWYDTWAEPIWVTAALAGLRVGNIMYPGAQRPVKGVMPEKVIAFSWYLFTQYSMRRRIDTAITWLTEDGLDMVLVYFDEPDTILQTNGIGHADSKRLLKEIDDSIGYLVERLHHTGIDDMTDLVIVSDHGMAVQEPEKYICIFDYLDPLDVEFVRSKHGPGFQLKPVEGKRQMVYQTLKTANPVLTVYLKEEFPVRFHYGNNTRNFPIIGFLEPGYNILTECDPKLVPKADHGYDHELPEMRACLYAIGPSFNSGYLSGVIKTVDVYNLMCDILNLSPAPNNGTRSSYKDMLRIAPRSGSGDPVLVVVVLIVIVLFIWVCLRKSENKHHHHP